MHVCAPKPANQCKTKTCEPAYAKSKKQAEACLLDSNVSGSGSTDMVSLTASATQNLPVLMLLLHQHVPECNAFLL